MSRRDKGRLPPFVPLLISTIDAPAWKAMSHGAKWLYVALRRRMPNGRNRAFVSYRTAQRELKASPKKIREWFAELVHYGFIKLAVHGCLGVDGKGKAPHWTLTECGQTSRASAEGLFEPPTNDFLKWDGILFDPAPFRGDVKWDRVKYPASHVGSTPLPTSEAPPFPTSEALILESVSRGVHIEADQGVSHVGSITSINHYGASQDGVPASHPSPRLSSGGSLEEENNGGQFNVVKIDPRIAALEAAEKKRRGNGRE
jgi:hypothetical protein